MATTAADAVVTVVATAVATAVVEVATKVAEHGVPDPDHKPDHMVTTATQATEVTVAETRADTMATMPMAVVIRPAATVKVTDSLMEVAPGAAAEVSTVAMEVKVMVKISGHEVGCPWWCLWR